MKSATPKPPARRFTLVDGMILVAATAAGLALARALAGPLGDDLMGDLREAAVRRDWKALITILLKIAHPVLGAWTVALIPLGLLGPRRRPRRPGRQPGWVVGLSSLLAAGFLAIYHLFMWVFRARKGNYNILYHALWFVYELPKACGLAILASWATLIVVRRWRAEPTWVDRLGRALGSFWILSGLATPFLLMLEN